MAPRTGTVDDIATYMISGYWNDRGESAYQWDTAASNVVTVDLTGLDAAGQTMARAALAAWESVADLDFREVTDQAGIVFDDSRTGATSSVAYDPRSGDVSSATVSIGSSWLAQYGATVGSYGFQTYMHEIGHALGLGHSGGYSGGATYADATWTLDSWQVSVMSYLDQDENPTIAADKAYVASPMMADIIAVQRMYGAAKGSASAGDTTYGEGSQLGGPLGSVFGSGPGGLAANALTIWDEGGIDTLNFSATSARQTIDLRAGASSNVYGKIGNVVIARGTVIEGASGGEGVDDILGNALANRLRGNGGADLIRGEAGRDSVYGGAGDDSLLGGSEGDVLSGDAQDDRLDGAEGADALAGGTGADLLLGGTGADSLSGGDGGDRLDGGDGNDRLQGGKGGDRLDGGAGNDALAGGSGADAFAFVDRGGIDVLADFKDNLDQILFDRDLWGGSDRAPGTVLLRFAAVVGGDAVFTFAGGEVVRVQGVADLATLKDDIGLL